MTRKQTRRPCPDCAAATRRMTDALRERDEALLLLAQAREQLAALTLAATQRGEPEPPPYPWEAGLAEPVPLRYKLADTLNTLFKVRAGWAHAAATRFLGRKRKP